MALDPTYPNSTVGGMADVIPLSSAPRAGEREGGRMSAMTGKLTVPHASAIIVLGALLVLVLLRKGFASALGD